MDESNDERRMGEPNDGPPNNQENGTNQNLLEAAQQEAAFWYKVALKAAREADHWKESSDNYEKNVVAMKIRLEQAEQTANKATADAQKWKNKHDQLLRRLLDFMDKMAEESRNL